MSSRVEERNNRVTNYLNETLIMAKDTTLRIDEAVYKNKLNKLFETTTFGYRELLLVILVGKMLDTSYKPSTALYSCSPRSLYEKPIRSFLLSNGMPHRKSGPLNIAKATPGINSNWAAQRDDPEAAEALVALVRMIETQRHPFCDNLLTSLLIRYLSEATRVESLSVEIDSNTDPEYLFNLCYQLIVKTPDSGNTPQRIAAFLLKNYHLSMHTGIVVTGENDSASTTSTTSKKPGDINEESTTGEIYKVYEITVKPFNMQRIIESHQCITDYNNEHELEIQEVVVICRSRDCPEEMKNSNLHGYLGSYMYQNVIYYFWDIYEWIANTLQRMTANGRLLFYTNLNSYISDINTSEAVKRLWRELHQ